MSVRIVNIELLPAGEPGLTRNFKGNILIGLFGTGAPYASPKCRLYVNDIAPDPSTPIEDFTVPSWTGYADTTLAYNPVGFTEFGAVEEFTSVDWISDLGANETVHGVVVLDPEGESVIAYGPFNEPIPVSGVESITVVVTIAIG